MPIVVEFFGIPRARAGVERTSVEATSLGEVLAKLAGRFPEFGQECLTGSQLRAGFLANLRGERFVLDPALPLVDGDSLLILSADAGG